jgi:hypothetical protein
MNRFETNQVAAAIALYKDGIEDYAADTLAYLTRVTKKQSTRQEVIQLIDSMGLNKYLEPINGVLVSKVEPGANTWFPASRACSIINSVI